MFGGLKDKTLKEKLLLYIMGAAFVISILMIIEIILLGYPLVNLITWVVLAIFSGLGFYFVYINKYVEFAKGLFYFVITFVILPYGWLFSSTRSPYTLGYAFLCLIAICYFFEGIRRLFGGLAVMFISAFMTILGTIRGDLFPVVNDYTFIINTLYQIPLLFGIAMFLLISFANDLKVKNAELQIASYTDYLTGLYNRRYIYEYLENLDRISDDHKNMIIGMIDVNGFKLINDQYGHVMGDLILKIVGNHIKSICGQDSIVGRIGGDEFVVIIKNYKGFSINEFSRKFEKAVIEFNHNDFKDISQITISGGFLACKKETPIDKMFSKADKNMYDAKGMPNNGIVFTIECE